MVPLGEREIEVPRFVGTPEALRQAIYNTAHYILDDVKPLGDGDTIGLPDTSQINVFHDHSMLDGITPVYRLEFV
jgi:hypothetical protein